MALTITKVFSHPVPVGDKWMSVYEIAGDASYPTGGYSLLPSDLGFAPTNDPEFHCEVKAAPGAGYLFTYDHVNQKVKAYWTGAGLSAVLAEVTNATNLSAVTHVRVLAFGRYPK